MGMPSSSQYFGELISQVLDDFIQEGFVVHIADDLHVCGNSVKKLINNWRMVLHRLQENSLKLSASKTVVCPKKTTVLGWIWNNAYHVIPFHLIGKDNLSSDCSSQNPHNVQMQLANSANLWKTLHLHLFAQLQSQV